VESAVTDKIVDQDVQCPLCGYNLRGLSEARCPECGGKFDWPDLLDPTRKLHPYLFEHHPRRNIVSFIRTVIGGLLPRRFWRRLHPAQPSSPRRLVLYWLIVVALCFVLPIAEYTINVADVRNDMLMRRQQVLVSVGLAPSPPGSRVQLATQADLNEIKQEFGSYQKYVDRFWPMPTFPVLLQRTAFPLVEGSRYAGMAKGNFVLSFAVSLSLALLIWPWIAALVMMILRTTVRQASIRRSHLMRVAIYSGDAVLCLMLLELAPLFVTLIEHFNNRAWMSEIWGAVEFMRETFLYGPLIILLILSYRFATAIRTYLRLPHAIGVMLSVQIIFLLLVLQVMSWICA
jgi:hypothetical protein